MEDQRVDAEHCLDNGMMRILHRVVVVAGAGISWSGTRFGYIAEKQRFDAEHLSMHIIWIQKCGCHRSHSRIDWGRR
ncbi:hypothetical protein [Lactiplantibacillus modestisalitolerans]|uniref:Uncharacterized protein n=1 Tax=Lactiplantibacillus modestisalitolerans TaxID=1457219 RepID=A0ABV5WVZ8_9LACO